MQTVENSTLENQFDSHIRASCFPLVYM